VTSGIVTRIGHGGWIAGSGADQIRTGSQLEDSEKAWPRTAGDVAWSGRRGDRI